MTDDELRAAYMAGAPGALAWPWPEGLRAVLAVFGAQPAAPAPVAHDEERIEAVLQRQYGQIAALEAEIAALKAANQEGGAQP